MQDLGLMKPERLWGEKELSELGKYSASAPAVTTSMLENIHTF